MASLFNKFSGDRAVKSVLQNKIKLRVNPDSIRSTSTFRLADITLHSKPAAFMGQRCGISSCLPAINQSIVGNSRTKTQESFSNSSSQLSSLPLHQKSQYITCSIILKDNKILMQSQQYIRRFSSDNPSNASQTSGQKSSSETIALNLPSDSDNDMQDIPKPTAQQKKVYAIQCAVPMIGFGFMDNIIMIQVGDLIDCTLGATFGFATITAAAMGQVCSDVSGVCFGGIVDATFARLGLPISDLTSEQLTLTSVRTVRTIAMALGVFSGCLLGMTSLLFMDLDKKERLKKQAALGTIFATLAEEGSDLCKVERCALYIVEDDLNHVWSAAKKVRVNSDIAQIRQECKYEIERASVNGMVSIRVVGDCLKKLDWKDSDIAEAVPADVFSLSVEEANRLLENLSNTDESRLELKLGGTKHWVVNNKKMLNIRDITKDDRFTNSSLKRNASAVGVEPPRSLLIGPVYAESDTENVRVIGLVEMVNKKNDKGAIVPFSRDDEKLMRMLCHHCSTFITQVDDD